MTAGDLPINTPLDDMARRERAYSIAREKVAELYAVKNDRGYPRFSGSVTSVLAEELTLARFLLDDER